ncbi:MAG: dCTP deaminase [Candidatus Doudnabacteria bacterium]|nr:dCTP deaminase [Candidatus Doudnabacteria bacterium]
MILSDTDIKKSLRSGRIKIAPAPDLKEQLGSCSIDFHLGNRFRVFKHSSYPFIDLRGRIDTAQLMKEIVIPKGEAFIMQSGDFALASTIESLELADDILGRIEGRSSLGRLGIIVHGTASIFDPGWIGRPTMELGNLGVMPVALYPGMRICAFTFEEVSSKVEVPYNKKPTNKYAGSKSPLASKITQELARQKDKGKSRESQDKKTR